MTGIVKTKDTKILLGQIIAVAFQKNILQLTNAHTGKVVHQIDCTSHSQSQICCLGWSINSTSNQSINLPMRDLGPDTSLDNLLSQGKRNNATDEPLDLPSDLAFLDVEAMLPKLSSLASGGAEYECLPSTNISSKLT